MVMFPSDSHVLHVDFEERMDGFHFKIFICPIHNVCTGYNG